MQVLTDKEIDMVFGGDSWAGTPEGRAPVPVPEGYERPGSFDFVGCLHEIAGLPGVSETAAIIYCGGKWLDREINSRN